MCQIAHNSRVLGFETGLGTEKLLATTRALPGFHDSRSKRREPLGMALATATADTWATELGVLSRQPPRLITTGKTVAPGTSGGITLLGTSAAALGALALGIVFWLLQRGKKSLVSLPLIALISGLVGSMLDSALGAMVQAMYYCPTCKKETERLIHNCGTKTRPLRGIWWLNNDTVNFIATLSGGLIAMAMYLVLALLRKM